jgi:hypothetical protein
MAFGAQMVYSEGEKTRLEEVGLRLGIKHRDRQDMVCQGRQTRCSNLLLSHPYPRGVGAR